MLQSIVWSIFILWVFDVFIMGLIQDSNNRAYEREREAKKQ